jgi:hypothetical protein
MPGLGGRFRLRQPQQSGSVKKGVGAGDEEGRTRTGFAWQASLKQVPFVKKVQF